MDWYDIAESKPQNQMEIVEKIINDGYTYPHFDKAKRGVKFTLDILQIKRDCKRLGLELSDVYPVQMTLF